jgi:hypothetical protein
MLTIKTVNQYNSEEIGGFGGFFEADGVVLGLFEGDWAIGMAHISFRDGVRIKKIEIRAESETVDIRRFFIRATVLAIESGSGFDDSDSVGNDAVALSIEKGSGFGDSGSVGNDKATVLTIESGSDFGGSALLGNDKAAELALKRDSRIIRAEFKDELLREIGFLDSGEGMACGRNAVVFKKMCGDTDKTNKNKQKFK